MDIQEQVDQTAPGYYGSVRKEMADYVPQSASVILEVGCAEGNFSFSLKRDRGNIEAWGVEYDASAAKKAESKLDRVFTGPIETHIDQLPDNYFDAIIFNDVLEHLVDPYNVLDRLRNKLKDKGVAISSIPNIRYFRVLFDLIWRKNWRYTDSGIMDRTHIRFFTIKSIREMYEDQNYKVILHEGIRPSKSLKPKLLNFLFFGKFSDIKYQQIATVATKGL
jgi:2-polyprenyl-3-methyl-5-hydroxy-6-metoxy-1,4-benzoquinol methylase